MTDLEITKLCAEAMGLRVVKQLGVMRFPNTQFEDSLYDPLHDDAQAMALVKRFHLNIGQTTQGVKVFTRPLKGGFHEADNADLNRAICECVAKMQGGK